MPLSRLENFLKNAEGNILYVNPSDFDATDGYENQGNSLTRPFKTIQRALIEAARFSYQNGRNNDRIDRTTILVYPGTHYIDNRPGYSIEDVGGSPVYKVRTGVSTWTETFLSEFGRSTNFDVLDSNNDLYKYNSVHGGVILPRGTSIIGLDLRKTKIRPLYVPDPLNDDVENSSIFNVTGTCYFSQFTFFDADINREVYKDYSSNKYVPNFSHHKLVAFTYGDGVNKVALANNQTDLTDLDMYYFKVARAYGDFTGRTLTDFPTSQDFEPSIDEYRIVGSLQSNPLGISSISSGDGITSPSNLITITTSDLRTGEEKPHGLFVDSPVYVDGVTVDQFTYNGSFTVKDVVGLTTFTYLANSSPGAVIVPDAYSSATVVSESDTVSSASPYIFNCSIRSVYGMCGMWANGAKADGFKSMVVAQFTGVSLQKDDNAFMIYQNGNYEDNFTLGVSSPERPLHSNSLAKYKPSFESYHIRVSDGGFVQCVSIFAIGYSRHFVAESGGDMSITNSNSNFGSVSLESVGFRDESFNRDDVGYITHIIPPRELEILDSEISWISFDVQKTISIGNTSRLYLYGYENPDVLPSYQVDGYRVGAKVGEELNLILTQGTVQSTYNTPVLMPVPSGTGVSSKKEYEVVNNGALNNISTNGVITFYSTHQLLTGEGVRIFSDNGLAPDNLECDKVYYAITNTQNPSLSSSQIQLAFSLNDALSGIIINNIGNNGGKLTIVSSVSDKLPGEIGSPIQYDSTNKNWYIVGAATSISNQIYKSFLDIGVGIIGEESPPSYIKRKLDNRSIEDRIYKIRYVVPKEFEFARPPQAGFVLQESKTVEPSPISYNENDNITRFTPPGYLRNEKIVLNVSAGSVVDGKQTITVVTEKPHNFLVGDKVKIRKVTSTNNPTGLGITATYNGSYYVKSVDSAKKFTYEISGVKINPGTITNDVNQRETNAEREALPLVSRDEYKNNFYIYRVNTVRRHIPGANGQDGIYHLIVLCSNVSPAENSNFDVSLKAFSQDVKNLYPQIDRDNHNYDPLASTSSADLQVLGKVLTNDRRNSITKESLNYFINNTRIGFGITGITATGTGNTTLTIYTDIEHGLNSIKSLNISLPGAGYGNTTLYSSNLVGAAGTNASVKALFTAGALTSISIVDSGSGYAVNDTLTITPYPGVSPSQNAALTVTEINNNVNDALEISGFSEKEFNGTFRILSVPDSKSVVVYGPSADTLPSVSPESIRKPFITLSADGIGISSITASSALAGIVTVTTSTPHGLLVGNKFVISGTGITAYEGTHTVSSVDLTTPLTKFSFNVENLTTFTTSNTGFVLKSSFTSNAASLGQGEESLASRVSYLYGGISSTINANLTSSSSTISLSDINGFNRGDYVLIGGEIIRLSSSAIGSVFNVLRGQFGTYKTTAASGSQVKKIKALPMELRRPSFMRASGHTFEYLGYGPGNYSTGMPQKQNITLSEDDVLTSQSRKQRGGVVVYSAMNDLGEFFSGNKKQSSTTGEEKVVEAPVLSYTGDDAKGSQSGKLSAIFDDLLVRERITVEGGENNNQTSQFYGPVNFTQKLTNTSELGINTKKLFVRGKLQQGKQITVGIGTTSAAVVNDIISPRIGDIVLTSNPIPQKHIGFTYDGSIWKKYGLISQREDILDMRMDRLGIGDSSVFDPFGGADAFDVYFGGQTILEDVTIVGSAIFDANVVLNDVQFRDLNIRGTAIFDIQAPVVGVATEYTQIHVDGTSILNNIDVVGISTFQDNVYFEDNVLGIGATFGNIQIAITNDNELDTSTGNLTIDSAGGTTIVDDNFKVTNGVFEAITGSGNTTTTTRIINSNKLQIGIGTTTNTSALELYERDNLGLSISRNAVGLGNTESIITHFGLSDFKVGTNAPTDFKIFTNNTERLRVGLSGTITSYQNNAGTSMSGSHLRISQSGAGDAVISWDSQFGNNDYRWYSGIDASDDYSWKIAAPKTTVARNSENFDTSDETKVRISRSTGDVILYGSLEVNSTSSSGIATISSAKQNFNLLDSNVLTLNIAREATTINVGSNSSGSYIQFRETDDATSKDNGSVRIDGGVGIQKRLFVGSSNDSTSKDTGSLVVEGGVGIEKNLYVGVDARILGTTDASSKSTGSLVVGGGVGIEKKLYVGSTDDSTSKDTGALIVEGGVGIEKKLSVGSTQNSSSSSTGALLVAGGAGIAERLFVGSNDDSTTKDSGALVVEGGVGIEKQLYVGTNARILGTTDSSSKDTGSLVVDGGAGIEKQLYVGTNARILGTTDSSDFNTGSLVVDGGAGIEKNLYVGANARIQASTTSTSPSTGTLVVSGGTGIGENLNVGGNAIVSGNATITGNLQVNNSATITNLLTIVTGIVPDADEGAYVGTSALPFSEAHIGEIRIANSTNNNTIDTASGNLILDSAGGTVNIQDNLDVDGDLNIDGDLTIVGGDINLSSATNININDNTSNAFIVRQGTNNYIDIDTNDNLEGITIGNSIAFISNIIQDNTTDVFTVSEGANRYISVNTTNGSELVKFETGNVNISNSLTVGSDLAVNGGDITTNQSTFNLLNTTATTVNIFGVGTDITFGSTSGTTRFRHNIDVDINVNIDGGNLTTNLTTFNLLNATATTVNAFGAGTSVTLGAASGTTRVRNNLDVDLTLNVDGTSTLVGQVQVNTGIVPDADEGAYVGTAALPFSEAHIGEIRIANSTNDNTIDTATGNLILDSAGGTVNIQDNLDVSGTSVVGSTLTVNSTTQSTSKDTGAIITEGGIGAEKNIFTGGYVSAEGAILGTQATGFYADASNIAVRTPATSPNGTFFVQNNGGTISFATFNNTEISFNRRLKINGSTSGYTIIQSPAAANTNTLTLPKAVSNINAYLAITNDPTGQIGFGDIAGNYVADITAGAGLTKNTSAGEGQAPTLAVGAGTGIAVDADEVRLANSGNLSANTILKWSGTNLTNSNITDNNTTIILGRNTSITQALTVSSTTNATTKDTGSIITEGGIGVEKNVYIGGDLTVDGGQIYLNNTATQIQLKANTSNALVFVETSDDYLKFDTTINKRVIISKELQITASNDLLFSDNVGTTRVEKISSATGNTITLPSLSGTVALTSSEYGIINLGTDTNGNYVADITAGAGLTKNTSAGEGQAPTLAVGAGTGIAVDADEVRLANSGNLSANTILKWSGTNLTNSTFTEDTVNNQTSTNHDIVIRNTTPQVYMRDTNDRSGILEVNSNQFFVISCSGTDSVTPRTDKDSIAFIVNINTYDAQCKNNFSAIGNITAYASDRRLKENFKSIESPLEKIQKLNGYTFDWKDEVKEFGFVPDTEKNEIGLIAQEVQEILPQAVAPAPFDQHWNGSEYESKSGENYLTVQYEKLVPLLVEAIKELKAEIEELKKGGAQ
jgi:hypothetical protein